MKFVSYDNGDGSPTLGLLRGERVLAVGELIGGRPRDVADIAGMKDIITTLTTRLDAVAPDAGLPVASVRLLSPIVAPGRVIGVGLNYRSHAEEQSAKIPRQPILFAKWSSSVVGPDCEVAIPYVDAEVDYECEVTVVIGRAGRDIPVESALDHVFGITAMNDLSDRKAQLAERQWTRAKSFDGFTPLGPTVVSLDEIPSVSNISLRTTLNGEVVQEGNTSDLIFDIPTLVAFASQGATLQPGDVIATGTPSGVGFVRQPPVYLAAGDVVTVTVEHVGDLTTSVAAARRSG